MTAILDKDGGGLVPVGYRFALGRPTFTIPVADPVPDSAPLPFGLRFFVATGAAERMNPPAYRYDPVRQVAVTDDEAGIPLVNAMDVWVSTTTGGADGSGPNVEEHKQDAG